MQTRNDEWHASWWKQETHGSAWERVKDAFKRDWEQTKNDFKAGGRDLNQDVGDTVKQAAGKEPIPPPNTPNWDTVEPAYNYGYSARQQFGSNYNAWNDDLDSKLSSEWRSNNQGKSWDEVKPYVRKGFEYKS